MNNYCIAVGPAVHGYKGEVECEDEGECGCGEIKKPPNSGSQGLLCI